jgi:serine/threonine protein kinase/tetratricopeptide (TPR) repeat protein
VIGQTLGHYEVLEQLGAGGMGVVYRARDLRLERDVALKVLPAGLLADAAARKRFRNEALALARLNHPNICSVFDFDTHEEIDFLVMEFVPGISLNERLARGSLSLEEVPLLGAQLAAGLEVAHEQGVLHRDLKPGNLRVTPDSRLKILDFGLAKLFHPGDSGDVTLSMNDTSSFSGTVPYMAPEQLRNDPPDPRTDIYSAGAVLYQCATGQRAFPENQLAKLISSILHDEPAAPTTLNRRISPGLESVIRKAMDRRPELRYQSARELRIDLERLASAPSPLSSAAVVARRPFPLGKAVLAFLFVLAAGVGIGLYVSRKNLTSRPPAATETTHRPAVRSRRAVAVIGFKNLAPQPETEWISTALSEMLTTELAAGERLRTISSENVSRMRTDLALTDSGSYAPDTLKRIRTISGCDAVVLGSYVVVPDRSGGKIRVNLSIQETSSGETLANVSETGGKDQLLDVVSRAGSKLRDSLGAPVMTPEQATQTRAAQPSSSAAARLYAEGLDKLRAFDSVAARDLLEKAAAADPSNAHIQVARAVAWGQLGYDEKARAAAKLALDLSTKLSREEHLSIEARYREAIHDYTRAVEIYKSLREVFPDNPDYAMRLATMQTHGGNPKEAYDTLDQLRVTFPAMKNDPRVDVAEASAADRLSDFKREQAAAVRAATGAKARGERLLAARALLLEGWAWHKLGDQAKATAVSLEAKSTYEAVGDRVGQSRALHNLANIAEGQGKNDEGEKYFLEAIATRRQIQDNTGLARALNDLAIIHEHRGDFAKARKLYEESLAITMKIGDQNGIANVTANLGNIDLALGHPTEARQRYLAAAAIYRENDNKYGLGAILANLGNIAENSGDYDEAGRLYEEAVQNIEATGGLSGAAELRGLLAGHYLAGGDLAAARKNFQQALDMASKAGDRATAAQSRTYLGALDRFTGDFPSALSSSETALAAAREAGDAGILHDAMLQRAGTLFVTGDIAGARKLQEQVLADAQKSGDQHYAAVARFDRGEVNMMQNDLAAASRDFAEVLASFEQQKDALNAAAAKFYSARLALEQRQVARAIPLLRQSLASARASKDVAQVVRCQLVLAKALLESSPPSIAEAQKSVAEASPAAEKSGRPDLQLGLAATSARVKAAGSPGAVAEARKSLDAALVNLGPKSSFDVRLDARLAVAELAQKAGDSTAAQSALALIEQEATSHGFLLAANKAKALASKAR